MIMTSVYQVIYEQTGISFQVTVAINNSRLWEYTVFVDHYSYYCYYHLMRGT